MSEKRKQINYAVACVSEFAHVHNLTVKEAFHFLFEYKAIETEKAVSLLRKVGVLQ